MKPLLKVLALGFVVWLLTAATPVVLTVGGVGLTSPATGNLISVPATPFVCGLNLITQSTPLQGANWTKVGWIGGGGGPAPTYYDGGIASGPGVPGTLCYTYDPIGISWAAAQCGNSVTSTEYSFPAPAGTTSGSIFYQTTHLDGGQHVRVSYWIQSSCFGAGGYLNMTTGGNFSQSPSPPGQPCFLVNDQNAWTYCSFDMVIDPLDKGLTFGTYNNSVQTSGPTCRIRVTEINVRPSDGGSGISESCFTP